MDNRNFEFKTEEVILKYHQKRKNITVVPKTQKHLISERNLKDMYKFILQNSRGKTYRDINIKVRDITGHIFNAKGYESEEINFENDYFEDRVANNQKFSGVAVEVFFTIKI